MKPSLKFLKNIVDENFNNLYKQKNLINIGSQRYQQMKKLVEIMFFSYLKSFNKFIL